MQTQKPKTLKIKTMNSNSKHSKKYDSINQTVIIGNPNMSMMITNRGVDSNSKFQKPNPSSPSDGNSSSSPNDFSGLSPSS